MVITASISLAFPCDTVQLLSHACWRPCAFPSRSDRTDASSVNSSRWANELRQGWCDGQLQREHLFNHSCQPSDSKVTSVNRFKDSSAVILVMQWVYWFLFIVRLICVLCYLQGIFCVLMQKEKCFNSPKVKSSLIFFQIPQLWTQLPVWHTGQKVSSSFWGLF